MRSKYTGIQEFIQMYIGKACVGIKKKSIHAALFQMICFI